MPLVLKPKLLSPELQTLTGKTTRFGLTRNHLRLSLNRYVAEQYLQTSDRFYVVLDEFLARLTKLEQGQVLDLIALQQAVFKVLD